MSEFLRLGDHCSKIGSGATPRGGKEAYLPTGPYKLIRSQNIYNHGFAFGGLAFIDEEQAKKLANVTVLERDVLVNITGDSVARVCQVHPDALPARVNQHVAIVRPDPKIIDANFLRYWFVTNKTQNRLIALASGGATRNALTKSMLESLEVPFFELDTQKNIADVLTALDDKIECNRRMNETLEAMAQAIFKDWFVDFGPIHRKIAGETDPVAILGGMIPELGKAAATAALFIDALGEDSMPLGWQKTSIGEIAGRIFSGGTPSTKKKEYWDGNVRWLSSGESKHSVIVETDRHISVLGIENSSTRLATTGSSAIASAGQGNTRGQVTYLGIDCYVNQSVIVVEPGTPDRSAFLYFDLRRRYIELRRISDGNSSRGSLTTSMVSGRPTVLPPKELLVVFEEVAGAVLNVIRRNLLQNQTLGNTRDYLLPRLMSRQVRVDATQRIAS